MNQAELDWWRKLYEERKPYYMRYRRADALQALRPFPPPQGRVLEVGSGLVSMMKFYHECDWLSVDPLAAEYQKILPHQGNYVAAKIEDVVLEEVFTSIYCINTIDHTEKPVGALRKMRLLLDGRLYLQILIKQTLNNCHLFSLDGDELDALASLAGFTKQGCQIIEIEGHDRYYATYS